MNALAEPFKQLVERRLWPVALLLVAGIVAVPLLLGKDPEPVAADPSALAAVPAGQGETEPVVSLGDSAARDEVRAVLGDRKDPFRPAQIERVPAPDDSLQSTATADPGASGSGDVGSGDGSSGGGGAPAPAPADPVDPAPPVDPDPAPQPTAEPDPKPTFELYSLVVRFGDVESGDLRTRMVKRLTGLPGGNPSALYLGVKDGGDTAVFLVDAGVEVVGDGECRPSGRVCETLELEEGETVFLSRGDKQFQLDLIRIHTRTTTDAAQARRLRSAVAAGGASALRRMGGSGGWRYDAGSGTLERVRDRGRALRSAFASAG